MGFRLKLSRKSVLTHAVLIFVSFIMIFPWLIALSTGLKAPGESALNRGLIPWEIALGNFPEAWRIANVPLLAFNSFVVTAASVVMILFLASLAAYGFARLSFFLKEPFYLLFLAGLMLQAAAIMVPLYQVNVAFGLLDTYYALVGPYIALGLPFAILILRGFFEGLPEEIEDAALIDGASRFTIYWRIMLPLTRPALATVAIFTGLGTWNDFLLPMLMTSKPGLRTMPLGLILFELEGSIGFVLHEYRFALIIMMTLPIVIVFLLLQRQFMSGLTAGAIKG
ncbi:MAG: carbohydrate ABC transporter permease [Caldilineaceae bacterium]|nr:carbohydrate ABC transporter permease [Caldilineaceae bacterium]MDE0463208.1 carbohydrate ABC transporter permease [Caldilineaceae bacterium]